MLPERVDRFKRALGWGLPGKKERNSERNAEGWLAEINGTSFVSNMVTKLECQD